MSQLSASSALGCGIKLWFRTHDHSSPAIIPGVEVMAEHKVKTARPLGIWLACLPSFPGLMTAAATSTAIPADTTYFTFCLAHCIFSFCTQEGKMIKGKTESWYCACSWFFACQPRHMLAKSQPRISCVGCCHGSRGQNAAGGVLLACHGATEGELYQVCNRLSYRSTATDSACVSQQAVLSGWVESYCLRCSLIMLSCVFVGN